MKSRVLVSDFDGTMTRHDFYLLVRAVWWNEADPDPWQDYLSGRLTHFEALNRFFAKVRGDERAARSLVNRMELDPDLPVSLERLHSAGWRVVIASAGCEWYIRQLLVNVKAPLEIHANPGRYDPEQGLQMIPPVASEFYSPQTGIDKVAVVRAELARSDVVAFAGDGPPDLPAIELLPPERRFARGWLADGLAAKNESFQALTNWTALTDRLLERHLT